jgi:hypothetical protein
MTIKFSYVNPTNGETLFAATREELIVAVASMAVDVYINHYTNGGPFSFVEVLEDGSEKWYSPRGEQKPSPDEVKAEAERILKHTESFANASVLPTTILGN